MALYYLDSSALVNLVRAESESGALRMFLDGTDLVSCDLVLTELPRAVRRAAALERDLPAAALLARADDVLDALALRPLDRALLQAAGAIDEPALRALDAVHVAAALDLAPHDGFVSDDDRKSAAARLAGLRTFAPGR